MKQVLLMKCFDSLKDKVATLKKNIFRFSDKCLMKYQTKKIKGMK